MKIGVIGTGAVGGYFGGKLVQAGLDVTFIARGETLRQLQDNGLKILSYKGDFEVKKPKVTSDLRALNDVDVVLLCVKSYSTKEVAKTLKTYLPDKAIIVSMQNGIENEDILSEILGKDKVVGSVVFITAGIKSPGVISHTGYGKVIFGELNGQLSDRIRNLEKVFIDAGIPAGVTQTLKTELWSKLMLNIPYNGFTALVRGPLANYQEIAEAQECFLRALKEVQLVAKHEGIIIGEEAVENAMKFTKNDKFGTFKSSTLLDVEAGKQLEIEALQGAVIRAAKKHNLDIPINKLLYSLLKMSYK
ncbi:MAG: 2-dehydropantoate 2-reductase [bacterium]